MTDFLEYVASTCTEIINDPENKVSKVAELLGQTEKDGIVLLALVKVFKSITPLYKIRMGTEKIKHRTADLKISDFDRELLLQYNLYVKQICSSQADESFRCASILLKTLDHFNFVDRLVSKVLVGTTRKSCAELCLESLVDRIENDQTGETVFLILNQCLDYKFGDKIIEALKNCQYLEKCVQRRIDKEEKYEKKPSKRSSFKTDKQDKEFFRKQKFNGTTKKEDKKRVKLQNEVRDEEKSEIDILDEKNYIKTVNALQRLYFTILKERRRDCLFEVFFGVRKYFRIIRKEFHEGLYTLLNDNLLWGEDSNYSVRAKIECINTILYIFDGNGLDMKKVLLALFELTHPMNYFVETEDFPKVVAIVEKLFVAGRQSSLRVNALVQRLLQARCIRYIEPYNALIKRLEVTYDLEFKDFDLKSRRMYDPKISDIDKIPSKPTYEYFLFRRYL